jgi:hypothetical protein
MRQAEEVVINVLRAEEVDIGLNAEQLKPRILDKRNIRDIKLSATNQSS